MLQSILYILIAGCVVLTAIHYRRNGIAGLGWMVGIVMAAIVAVFAKPLVRLTGSLGQTIILFASIAMAIMLISVVLNRLLVMLARKNGEYDSDYYEDMESDYDEIDIAATEAAERIVSNREEKDAVLQAAQTILQNSADAPEDMPIPADALADLEAQQQEAEILAAEVAALEEAQLAELEAARRAEAQRAEEEKRASELEQAAALERELLAAQAAEAQRLANSRR